MRDMTAKELLVMDIEIGRPTIDRDFGKQLLELFASHDKRLVPQTLSIWSDKVADLAELENAQPHWAGIGTMQVNGALSEFHVGVGWHRKLTTRYQAEIRHESRNVRGRLIPATLSVYAKPHKAIDWRGFANRLYEFTEAQYGFVHLHRDAHLRADLSEAQEPNRITAERTTTSVPQLGWSTFLGKPYAEFGQPILDASKNGTVVEIGDGAAITVTESIMDVANSYKAFDQERAKLKARFPEKFFIIP